MSWGGLASHRENCSSQDMLSPKLVNDSSVSASLVCRPIDLESTPLTISFNELTHNPTFPLP